MKLQEVREMESTALALLIAGIVGLAVSLAGILLSR